MSRAILLTGATGFLGGELLARWLQHTDALIYVLVRAQDEVTARRRARAAAVEAIGAPGSYLERIVPLRGDLTEERLGLAPRMADRVAEDVGTIVHGAATVSFTTPPADARRVNVEGTGRVLELAEQCAQRGGLERLAYVSTAYVAGDSRGLVREDAPPAGRRFRNAYERSKHEAEQLLHEQGDGLPLDVLRPSIVVGERASGWTGSFNVLYGPLRAFARGAYSALPGNASSPVDVVSVDYVADAVFALARDDSGGGRTLHLTAGDAASTVGEILELAARRFGRPAPRLLPPRLYRRCVHPFIARGEGRRQRMLRRSEVYFPYFAVRARYDDSAARAALDPLGIRPSPLGDYFDRLVDFAVTADWGRTPVGRAEVRRAAGAGADDDAGGVRAPAAAPAPAAPLARGALARAV